VSLPGASELFRPTQPHGDPEDPSAPGPAPGPATLSAVESAPEPATAGDPKQGGGSGRVRHDEKITVYVSSEELLALERARLELRARHGLAVDRGRIVREAIAAMLADLETGGERSQLVRRLS
jgi:hypothetical protein